MDALSDLDWDSLYPLAGPVAMTDAEPGDILAVEVLDMHTAGWGWTAVLPGFGLLPEDFPDAYLKIFDLTNGDYTLFKDDIAIPIEPFFGTMGVSPTGPEASDHAAWTVRRQHGYPSHHQGFRAVPARAARGRALLLRRRPCGPGRRRGLRHRHREPHVRRLALRLDQGQEHTGTPVPDPGTINAVGRRGRLVRDDGRERRSDAGSERLSPGRWSST